MDGDAKCFLLLNYQAPGGRLHYGRTAILRPTGKGLDRKPITRNHMVTYED